MGRRKRGQENIRKLGQFRNISYFVTLPISFVRNLGWKEGQKLFLFFDRKNKTIVIQDWEKKRRTR